MQGVFYGNPDFAWVPRTEPILLAGALLNVNLADPRIGDSSVWS